MDVRCLTLIAVVLVGSAAADPKAVLPASEARNHVDAKGTYEMVVQLSKDVEPRQVYYLDSEKDFHDENNLAVVISYDDARKFKAAGVDDPSTFFKGKTIRVTGLVIHESDQTRIHVTDPTQIEVVDTAKKPS